VLGRTLNLGILAHVDAGKTTLTERLLYAAGVIEQIGSVDKGTTRTDSLALEQQRGITIKSAVVSFAIDDLTVNLIDTPGHPDFIAEVERVLAVLDGAVLVISAVEGVQPQTRILMRALDRRRIPTLIFINKADRRGADCSRVLGEIGERLPARARAHPVFCGSARTGAGVDALIAGIAGLLPTGAGELDGPVSGLVFKTERGRAGERIAYVRMFSGAVRVRDRVRLGTAGEAKVTGLRVFAGGADVQRRSACAGQIAKLWGLTDVRIGDAIGDPPKRSMGHEFAPPTLEAIVAPLDPDGRRRLRLALAELAEQDPLINVRQDDQRREISVSLYGEVQKEVIQATLEREYGVEVEFRETSVIHIERLTGSGRALEILQSKTKSNVTGKSSPTSSNPFLATLGLRVDPAPAGSGVEFRLDVDARLVPMYIYRGVDGFREQMARYVREALGEGPFGWRVTDCTVTLNDCGYKAPGTTAADFRRLTPVVLMQALEQSGTVVCQPISRITLEIPAGTVGTVMAALARLGTGGSAQPAPGQLALIETLLPAARVPELQRRLSGLTHGEGVLETTFEGYEAVNGAAPTRQPAGVS
jgi:ribosomal protection tetracycline resistance protein